MKTVVAKNPIVTVDLKPVYDSRKSFYGKAVVKRLGNVVSLYSYNTFIESVDLETGEVKKSGYYNYSVTTKRHQREFERQYGIA